LLGEQQSEDWDKPRADRTAWRRTDTAWLAPRAGIAYKFERVVERRDPARREATHKSVLRCELDSSLQYPGQLCEDRRQEIVRAHAFGEAAAPLLQEPLRSAAQLNALLNRINYHLEHEPPTPYREAIYQVRRQVEAARRGETFATLPEEKQDAPAIAVVGQPAPDFVASDLTGSAGSTARLRNWLGRPTLLVFYHPASPVAANLLEFARSVYSRFNGAVTVLGMSVLDDARAVQKQQKDLNLGFPVLSGSALRVSYAVETTPKLVLIDARGVVRGTYLGWGQETSAEVMNDLRQWLQRP